MLRFDANLYRIATACTSKEGTLYYLQGVNVEPHAVKGVVMTSTDGYRLICIHDENGVADETAIVRLSAESLKACKPGKGETRVVTIPTGASLATVNVTATDAGGVITDSPRTMSDDCRIDGTFPNYRRHIPTFELPAKSVASFNGLYLGEFGKVAKDLEAHFGCSNSILQVAGGDAGSPHLIFFATSAAFGVLMPVRNDTAPALPEWFNAKPEMAQAAK